MGLRRGEKHNGHLVLALGVSLTVWARGALGTNNSVFRTSTIETLTRELVKTLRLLSDDNFQLCYRSPARQRRGKEVTRFGEACRNLCLPCFRIFEQAVFPG
jgi:hypothetical protein